jgi:adenine-specific DNA-methyltransferase
MRALLFLDSFAGSGTTAHAVLAANNKDGGDRRFILVECEDYADKLTAERVRRVINGYEFTGTQKGRTAAAEHHVHEPEKSGQAATSKLRASRTWKSTALTASSKTVKDGVLVVSGERKVKEHAEGLGGDLHLLHPGRTARPG